MMQLKTKNLKFMNKYLLIILFFSSNFYAQEELAMAENSPTVKKVKVDGVTAVVGDYIILESDIDKALIELKNQGVATENITRCNLLGKLLEDKLYTHHAIQDSIVITDAEVYGTVDQQINYFAQQFGGDVKKMLAFYKKKNEAAFRKELYEINKAGKLASKMQKKIVEAVEITPEETYDFFNSIAKKDRPVFGAELKLSQIVIKPKVAQEEKDKVIDKLNKFRADIVDNGASFATKAVLYSQDPGSRSKGGKYTLNKKRPRMVKEFREVAFSLEEGEVSQPIESDFGFHLITVDKIRGQELDVRHILLIPETTKASLEEAKERLTLIRKRIKDKELSFEAAAMEFSEEEETKNDGGKLINPETLDYSFELTKMDPTLYTQVSGLKEAEVSVVTEDEDRRGNKSYKIYMVTDRLDEHTADYSTDYLKIKDLALKEKQIEAIENWQNDKIDDTYIKISEFYKDCDFSSNWLKK